MARACRLFHESLHHAPDAYGQRGLLPDGNHYAELWAGDLFIVSSASGETAQLVALAKKARQFGGAVAVLTTNRHATITEFVDVIVQINAPSKIKRFCFPLGTADGVVV